jgi:hypothetical protein
MDDRDERAAKNETLLRAANREIELANRELGEGPDSEMEALCECGSAQCDAMVTLTMAEYERAHSQADRFVVLPGHEDPAIEHVVERRDGYLVVDKFGGAEGIAERRND